MEKGAPTAPGLGRGRPHLSLLRQKANRPLADLPQASLTPSALTPRHGMERGRGRPPSAAAAALVALISLRAGPLGWIPTAAAAASSAGGHSSSSSANTSSPGPARADRRLARDLEGQSRALDHDIALDLSGVGADATGEGEGGLGEAASSSDVLNADDIGLIDSIFGSAMGAADLANGGGGDGAKIPAEREMEMETEMEMDGPSLNAGPAFHPDEAAQQQERHTPPVRYRRHKDEDEMDEEEEQPAAPSAPYGTGGFDDDQDFYDYYDATYADAVDPDRPTADTYEDLDANPASGPTSYSGQDARPAAIKEEAPPPDGPGHGLEDIVRAHREALSRDLDGVTQRPARAAFVPQSRSFPGAGAGAGARAPPVRPSKVPPSYGANLAESSSSNPGPPPPPSSSSPPSNPSAAKRRERARKAEQNLLRTVASEVHTTYTTALSSVIRGDASAHVPAGIFGQSLTEERAGTRLAGLGSEYDVNGMYNYGPYGTEEELRSFSDWSALLHSTSANQCGAVDIKTAEAKLYGGAQYHRCVRSFSALLLTLPLPTVTDEELSLLMAATGSAGSGGGHDGPDLLRTASILCQTKMEGLVRYALDELAGRVEYILGQRCWDCVNYSALIRPASETRTDMINYGSEDSERERDARRRGRVDAEEASERYSDLEDTFRELVRTAYGKFVKENVSRAATMGWTDAMALLRCKFLLLPKSSRILCRISPHWFSSLSVTLTANHVFSLAFALFCARRCQLGYDHFKTQESQHQGDDRFPKKRESGGKANARWRLRGQSGDPARGKRRR